MTRTVGRTDNYSWEQEDGQALTGSLATVLDILDVRDASSVIIAIRNSDSTDALDYNIDVTYDRFAQPSDIAAGNWENNTAVTALSADSDYKDQQTTFIPSLDGVSYIRIQAKNNAAGASEIQVAVRIYD